MTELPSKEILPFFTEGGMAAVVAVLLMILFWLIKQLITLQKETNQIIAEHNKISARIFESQERMVETLETIHIKLIARPCIRDGQ
jgi:hypothetical protein